MDSTATALTLVIVSVLAVVVVLSALLWSSLFTMRPGPFLRYASLSAFASFGSSLVYLIWAFQGDRWIVAIGDALMLWGPACLWVALSSLNGRFEWRAWVAVSSGVAMFVLTLLVPESVSSAVKIGVMLVYCVAVAYQARTPPASARRGMATITLLTSVYAVFCGGRLVAAGVGGMEGELYREYFSTGPTTIVGVVTVIFIAYGVLRAAQDPRPAWRMQHDAVRTQLEERARALLEAGESVNWRTVSLPELSLMRESFGEDYVQDAHLALLTACRDAAAPGAEVGAIGPARIVMVEPSDSPEPSRADLRTRFARASPTLTETYVPDVDIVTLVISDPEALAEAGVGSTS
ncbi:hypothetical protein F6J84_12760 [Microbacterium caowuchunii]|uniref:hypothetical protein n=1 Tax=Microbacterium caowuchunii TaxID=2614638 RepID=UPI001243E962|nr:hypothetical protein [Microbacterium caowuchunii]QEW00889.1 hypothetical protein F6J84_12760 [Microbacterium caowuchunii]